MFTRLRQFFYRNLYSLNINRSSSSKAAIIVFLLTSATNLAVVWRLEKHRLWVERSRISNVAYDYADNIQRSLESSLSITYALSALVQEYRGNIPNFETVARDLLPLHSGAYAVALLPNGKVEEIVTAKNSSSKAKIDYNQLRDLHQTKEATIARNEEQLILTVPFTLRKNFSGALGYLPIYLENERGESSFWGFATVTILFPEIFQEVNLARLTKLGFDYQIWRIHPDTNRKQVIASSRISALDRPVEQQFDISNGSWTLSLTPIAGWNSSLDLFSKLLLGFCLSLMLAALVKLFLESKLHASELEKTAHFDTLTGLPNRRLLLYRLNEAIARSQRSDKKIAICCLDLDNFKAVNRSLGCKAGDYLLVRIAKRLQKFVRAEDIIARVGGDEFVIVLQDLSYNEEVKIILERIIEAITNPIVLDSQIISVSASIGVTIFPHDNCSINALLRYADKAMSYSKKQNIKSYTLFSELKQTTAKSSTTQA